MSDRSPIYILNSNGQPVEVGPSNPLTSTASVGSALAPYGSNPTQTAAAAADTLYKFGAGGITPFTHIVGQNNSPQMVYLAFDQDSTASTSQVYVIASGQPFSFDRSGTVLHFSSATPVNFAGKTGITVEAFA